MVKLLHCVICLWFVTLVGCRSSHRQVPQPPTPTKWIANREVSALPQPPMPVTNYMTIKWEQWDKAAYEEVWRADRVEGPYVLYATTNDRQLTVPCTNTAGYFKVRSAYTPAVVSEWATN